jgi:hypothetical protein
MLAREISGLVSMPRLLKELGFAVNERSHRCPCILHAGRNPGSFSWTETGKWFCFTQCGGGDRISLVMAARHCDFKTALRFLAALAGVDLEDSAKFRDELARVRRDRKQREIEQANFKAAERRAFLEARNNVLDLERLRRNAARRLADLAELGVEKFCGEEQLAWEALAFVAGQMLQAAAAFTVIAFADSETRVRFALQPEQRAAFVADCLEAGGVLNDKRHFVGMAL